MDALLEAMLRRRSARAYRERPVEDQLLRDILLVGINAPSAHDSRPWRIAAIKTPQGKRALMEALASRFRADMEKAGFSPEEIARRLERSQGIFTQAPVLAVLFARVQTPENRLAAGVKTEQTLTTQSVAAAAGQILMAASHAGLGGCWFAAPLFCPGEVCAACGLEPSEWTPQCLLTLGYPAAEPKEKSQPRLEDCVFFL